jgi:ribonuclease T1
LKQTVLLPDLRWKCTVRGCFLHAVLVVPVQQVVIRVDSSNTTRYPTGLRAYFFARRPTNLKESAVSFKTPRQMLLGCVVVLLASGVMARQMPEHESIAASALPPQARTTLVLIKRGGPFPYTKDGSVFGNYEQQLPREKRGYYHEYTVPTPGVRSRGARRIIVGGQPPQGAHYFYTADHYTSFRRIKEE